MSEKETGKFRRLPTDAQPRNQMYEMSMRFKADAGIRAIDDMLSQCFPGEGLPRLQDALVLRMHQVVPFVPDDGMLAGYAKLLQDGYAKTDTVLSNVRFDGYDYLYAVEPDGGNPEPDENHEEKGG